MTEPMDMSKDPDRYVEQVSPPGPLDPAADPDRFRGQPTLPGLLGEGAYEEPRETLDWLLGLLAIFAFLGLVSLLVLLL
jgi:hypothetical protein